MELLGQYDWPGNVRELENVLHSASVVSKGKRILTKDLPNNLASKIENENFAISNSEIPASQPIESPRQTKGNTKDSTSTDTHDESSGMNFGQLHKRKSEDDNLSTAPSSVSSQECFDMAYAFARKETDRNLIETVEKEIIQRGFKNAVATR